MNDQTPVPAKTRVTGTPVADGPFGWLRTEIDRLFDDVARPARSIFNFGASFGPLPAVDVESRDHDYRVSAELPGMKEDEIEVGVADGVLTISGEKREQSDRRQDGRLLSERRYGSFSRSVSLPVDADADKITADFAKGVLTITIPKSAHAETRARKIDVKAG